MNTCQLVLASGSPRRRELLEQIGVSHIVQPVDIDETPLENEVAKDYVLRMAAQKAAAGRKLMQQDFPVLACDTAVVVQDKILGKPVNRADALHMLTLLSGTTHRVFSAVSVWGQQHKQALCITEVEFRPLTDTEMQAYWHSGEPLDKAGSYAIQGLGGQFVKQIRGSYSGVVGLPLYETVQLLQGVGISTALQKISSD